MNTATNLIDDLRILEAPHPWSYWAWWAGAAVVLAAVVFWWLKLQQARSNKAVPLAAAHAHEDALAALERARALIQPGNSKAYAIEVSGIVRRYIENRFGIRAPHRSTEEFLEEAKVSPKLEPGYQQSLGGFLIGCDFIKFARGIAELAELETLHGAAVRFVTETKISSPATGGVPVASKVEAAR
ncbi:MAG: hypothetical protein JWM16_517 [Verrucomicrobiales bacterium]|nr:hypothetical protein [Verrucomicrobiales bacterium]